MIQKAIPSTFKFRYTTAIKKLRKLKKRIKVIPGGTSAGKTFGILPILIDRATKTAGLEISVVSESIPHLRRGALKDFLKIMKATNRYVEAHYNRTLLTYTFANGSYIEFFSADQEDKLKGARRNILYVNEANNIDWESYYQLAIRTDGEIWIDFNPTNEFWAHYELQDDPDVDWMVLTYLDNEGLSDTIVKDIEKGLSKAYVDPNGDLHDPNNIISSYWANWWQVYGLGQTGKLEGVIFDDWEKIATVPKEARLIGYGLDFGFTNDPTVLMALYRHDGRYLWEELIYSTGLTNQQIAKRMQELGIRKTSLIVADSSEPKSIAEINEYGFTVKGSTKGKDSINFGIGVLQEEKFYVTKDSTNAIDELRKYSWDRDKTGKSLNRPIDKYNHACDAMRYIATAKISAQKRKKGGVRRRN
jgi:phage terminase large subunit